MSHSQEVIAKANQIKKETGAILIWGVQYENTDNWIKMYNEPQVEFMKEVHEKYSIFSSILISIFENRKDATVDELREAYFNEFDFID